MQVITANLGTFNDYIYTVIFAKHNNQWLYCRSKARNVFETAGGHIEPGETPLEAAKRELYEETGASDFDITPAFDYSVTREDGTTSGQVFFAKINTLGPMPDFEMAEVGLFDALPDKMRFPEITPILYNNLQVWLNIQTKKDELWDIYDANCNPTGKIHRRGDPLPPGDYHLMVMVCILNSKGQFLITKRDSTKGHGGMWEFQGGSAEAGDNSLAAALREAKEEVGLSLNPEKGKCIQTIQRNDGFIDIWIFRQDFDIKDVVLQPGETVDVKYATTQEIREMIATGQFVPGDEINDAVLRLQL